ncbi:protein BANP isoform X1 [Clupea harengus]|uniref:Protein BANP n=1 Tax=Clupea harengus TaxID=7950 RepID=A0A6P8FBQ2_CLUHA|nr:protein BANP isoform X1 [Clupea harengus]
MMAEHDLVEMVQIAVEDLGQEDQSDVLENHNDDEGKPDRKRARVDISSQDATLKSLLFSMNQSICQRLDSMEAKLQVLEATCRALEDKLDSVVNKNQGPIQVPMVAGSPLGATQTWNKVRCVVPQTNVIVSSDKPKIQEETSTRASESLENLLSNTVGGRRQNTILVKVPVHEESQDEQESGSEASDSMPGSGQGSAQNHNNVTLITLNSEEDYPTGTWLGDDTNAEMRVRCPISAGDMLHISTNCRTAEKMALTLLDYLFHREVQAMSNLSGQGKHGKKQLDPLMIYGIRCHLFHKFAITESDWYRIKQSIDSKCRTAWRRKQRGQSLAVKSFSRRTPSSQNNSGNDESGTVSEAPIETTQQALHYALANPQQVQIHRIGEDGQVQVIHGASLEPISIDLERRGEIKNKYSLSNNVTMASKTERSTFEEAPPSFICCVGTFWFQCSMLEWWEISLRLCVWFVCVCL